MADEQGAVHRPHVQAAGTNWERGTNRPTRGGDDWYRFQGGTIGTAKTENFEVPIVPPKRGTNRLRYQSSAHHGWRGSA